jgi:FAD-dependent urate hydroxylase
MSASSALKVLIAGGGIAGPAAAIALHKAGIDVEIFEAYPPPDSELGAFVTIAANGQDALRAIDVEQPVLDASFPAQRMRIFDPSGTQLADVPLGATHAAPRTITRAALSRTLVTSARSRGISVHYGKRLTGADGASVRFADGSSADGDLLIGADGVWSEVRNLVDPAAPAPHYTGLTVVCGYADSSPVRTDIGSYDMCYGNRGFFGHTTGPDGRQWWFARIPEREPLDPPRYAEVFKGDGTPAADIIDATDRVTVTSAYAIPTLPAWHNDSTVVIGDAAHAASPSTAQGASMALEDAVILAQCLRDRPSVPEALAAFEHLRRDRAERVVANGLSGQNPVPQPPGPRSANAVDWLFAHHIDWNATVLSRAQRKRATTMGVSCWMSLAARILAIAAGSGGPPWPITVPISSRYRSWPGGETRKSMRAGTVPGLANAWGHPAGTNMAEPGPPRCTCWPEADSQLCQSPAVLTRGSKASRSSSPSRM